MMVWVQLESERMLLASMLTGGDYLNASRPLTNSMAVGDRAYLLLGYELGCEWWRKGFDFKSAGTTIFTVIK